MIVQHLIYRSCSELFLLAKINWGSYKKNIDIPDFTVGQQMHACTYYKLEALLITIVLFDASLALLRVFLHSMYFYFNERVNYLPLLRIIGLRNLVTADNLQETQKIIPGYKIMFNTLLPTFCLYADTVGNYVTSVLYTCKLHTVMLSLFLDVRGDADLSSASTRT